MKKIGGRILLGALLGIFTFIGYIVWDNNRITVTEEDIAIDDMPEELEGFRILQVSDLQEKEFGNNQKRLIGAINDIDYDAIVFTGDILDNTESTNHKSFYAILDGITDKENAWFVPGNDDPYSYQFTPDIEKSEFIKGMEQRGVELLESVETIKQEGVNIHFVNFELSIISSPEYVGTSEGVVTPPYNSNNNYLTYQKQLWQDMKVLDDVNEADVVIALNHYPVVDNRIDFIQNNDKTIWRDYDLIMAGHYHGGQFRLPFVGALFVPEPWNKSSFFPPNDRVKGLWEYKQTKQYVSAGLGSSDALSFLKFRLFNPPEINLDRKSVV